MKPMLSGDQPSEPVGAAPWHRVLWPGSTRPLERAVGAATHEHDSEAWGDEREALGQLSRELAASTTVTEAAGALVRAIACVLPARSMCLVCATSSHAGSPIAILQWSDGLLSASALPAPPQGQQAGEGRTLTHWERLSRNALRQTRIGADKAFVSPTLLPLAVGIEVLGALVIGTPAGTLTKEEGEVISWMGRQVACAIENLLVRSERDALLNALQAVREEAEHLRQRVLLTDSLASVGALVCSVAHELNNPLTSVIGYTQLLMEADVPETMRADLQTIESEGRRCQKIVQNLLSFARPQEDRPGPVSINSLIQRTLDLKRHSLRSDGIEVRVGMQPDLPDICADAFKIQQVLLNLVNNAHESMVQADQRGVLEIHSQSVQQNDCVRVRVSVADTGPGVPPEIWQSIFEPFFSTKRQRHGTGLGLSISRQIAVEAGGSLTLDPLYTGGARFILDLPQATNTDCAERPNNASTIPSVIAGAAILAVDDEPDVIDLVGRVLGRLGHTVEYAYNGAQALDRLAQHHYDVVILDIKMPGMSGREVYRAIQDRFPQLLGRVIFATGDLASIKTVDWLQSTGCPVLEKPFDITRLTEAVSCMLQN